MTETIRRAFVEDAPGMARVHVDSWRTTYKGIVPDEVLANLSYEQREQMWRQGLSNPDRKTYEYVAKDERGRIVGFISGGPERDGNLIYKGELYAIYILKEAQHHGLGHRLTLTLVESLVQTGLYSMLVWMLADNPSRRFYESLGGKYVSTKQYEAGGRKLDEIGYGWEDIRMLL